MQLNTSAVDINLAKSALLEKIRQSSGNERIAIESIEPKGDGFLAKTVTNSGYKEEYTINLENGSYKATRNILTQDEINAL